MRVPKKNEEDDDSQISFELGWKVIKAQAKGRFPTICATLVAFGALVVIFLK